MNGANVAGHYSQGPSLSIPNVRTYCIHTTPAGESQIGAKETTDWLIE
jgi:hypothetical protein